MGTEQAKGGDENLFSDAGRALSKLGAAKGGAARAKSLTSEERSQIARHAVESRWRKAGKLTEIAQATHGSPDRPLRIGSLEIPCYVLSDERRVLAQRGMITALGMSLGGSSHGQDRLAKFAGQDRLKPFAVQGLSTGTLEPIEFYTPQGQRILGYEATLLADICDAVLAARTAGALTKKQEHVAAQCEILVRGFARVGIIALVDEATGYQDARTRDALAKILEAFVAKELKKWVRTFPLEYFKQLCRLRNVAFSPKMKLPQYFGKLTNDVIYSRLAPGVLAKLREKNPATESGRRKHKFFQWLTEDFGNPKLLEHLAAVVALMRIADDWDSFYASLDKAGLPVWKALPLFDELDGVVPLVIEQPTTASASERALPSSQLRDAAPESETKP